jgi:hypothetical protein
LGALGGRDEKKHNYIYNVGGIVTALSDIRHSGIGQAGIG